MDLVAFWEQHLTLLKATDLAFRSVSLHDGVARYEGRLAPSYFGPAWNVELIMKLDTTRNSVLGPTLRIGNLAYSATWTRELDPVKDLGNGWQAMTIGFEDRGAVREWTLTLTRLGWFHWNADYIVMKNAFVPVRCSL